MPRTKAMARLNPALCMPRSWVPDNIGHALWSSPIAPADDDDESTVDLDVTNYAPFAEEDSETSCHDDPVSADDDDDAAAPVSDECIGAGAGAAAAVVVGAAPAVRVVRVRVIKRRHSSTYQPEPRCKKHGVIKSRCYPCGGKQACRHAQLKSRCVKCNGKHVCEHRRVKYNCSECRAQKA